MEKRYKYINEYFSRDLFYQKIRPLRDAAFGTDCLTPLKILKIIRVYLKIDFVNAIKNCYMLKKLSDFNL